MINQVTNTGTPDTAYKSLNKPPLVLVGYATRYGSTQEVAEVLATTLRECGLEVDFGLYTLFVKLPKTLPIISKQFNYFQQPRVEFLQLH